MALLIVFFLSAIGGGLLGFGIVQAFQDEDWRVLGSVVAGLGTLLIILAQVLIKVWGL